MEKEKNEKVRRRRNGGGEREKETHEWILEKI